jgi:hypothetical protein
VKYQWVLPQQSTELLQRTTNAASTPPVPHVTLSSSDSPLTQGDIMATPTQLSELEQRHRALEDEITEALQHPSTDQFKLAELKRRKLQVKDQIARLRTAAGVGIH